MASLLPVLTLEWLSICAEGLVENVVSIIMVRVRGLIKLRVNCEAISSIMGRELPSCGCLCQSHVIVAAFFKLAS